MKINYHICVLYLIAILSCISIIISNLTISNQHDRITILETCFSELKNKE